MNEGDITVLVYTNMSQYILRLHFCCSQRLNTIVAGRKNNFAVSNWILYFYIVERISEMSVTVHHNKGCEQMGLNRLLKKYIELTGERKRINEWNSPVQCRAARAPSGSKASSLDRTFSGLVEPSRRAMTANQTDSGPR